MSAVAVAISGDGLAACCCARLLQRAGVTFEAQKSERPRVPALLASPATGTLLEDIFSQPNIFHGFHRICRRVVSWNDPAGPISLPHAAHFVPEQALLDRLWGHVEVPSNGQAVDWTIVTTRGQHALPEEMKWGTRIASIARARLRHGVPADACWVEAVRDGWLFLLSAGEGAAWLIAVGSSPEEPLQQSRLVSEQIDTLEKATSRFPTYPRILSQLTGPDWLACGSGAMSFDPVCGEGAGNAAREAILASAVINAIADGENPEPLLAHYRSRLLGGFLRHLQISLEFYTRARQGPWWDAEIALLEQGVVWTSEQMRNLPPPRFRLTGFRLAHL